MINSRGPLELEEAGVGPLELEEAEVGPLELEEAGVCPLEQEEVGGMEDGAGSGGGSARTLLASTKCLKVSWKEFIVNDNCWIDVAPNLTLTLIHPGTIYPETIYPGTIHPALYFAFNYRS